MPRTSKTSDHASARKVLHGIAKRFSSKEKHMITGKSYTAAQLAAPFEAFLAVTEEVRQARTALKVVLAKEKALATRVKALTTSIRAKVDTLFAGDVVAYADFGWEPPKKRGPKTVTGKVEGVKKRAARRAAQGTKGTR